MEMSQFLELSNQSILLTWRRVLLANCPHEAECVNIQVAPYNTVPSGWTVSAQAHLVDYCSSGDCGMDSLCCDNYVLPCSSYHYLKV